MLAAGHGGRGLGAAGVAQVHARGPGRHAAGAHLAVCLYAAVSLIRGLYSVLFTYLQKNVDSQIFRYTQTIDPIRNPYSPGAGTPPPLLAGRDEFLDAFNVVIGRAAAGRPFQPLVLSGLRGVGKTVLLRHFRNAAIESGWIGEMFEARPGSDLRTQVAEALPPMVRAVNRRWRNKDRARNIGRTAASFAKAASGALSRGGIVLPYEPKPGVADSTDLEADLIDLLVALGEGAREEGVGAALMIDELQDVPVDQLGALIGASHRINQDQLPVVLGGAGLPPVGRILSEARSYSERLFSIRSVGRLSAADSSLALSEPAEQLNVRYETKALEALVDVSGGYPFFVQTYGMHTWDRADGSPITVDDVGDAVPQANRELNDSFFKPRYDRATPAERRYMHTVAESADDPASSSEVAKRLDPKNPNRASPLRDNLINKGLIYAPERGQIAFTVPHMGTYLRDLPT